MTLQDIMNKYDGKYLEYDGRHPNQCKDLFSAYNDWVLGNEYIYGHAKDMLKNGIKSGKYTRVYKPAYGDIVVWGTGIGDYGHIALFYSGTENRFNSFDQNYPIGSRCHMVAHTSKNVIGFMRPKKGDEMASKEYEELRLKFKNYATKKDLDTRAKSAIRDSKAYTDKVAKGIDKNVELPKEDQWAIDKVKQFGGWLKGLIAKATQWMN